MMSNFKIYAFLCFSFPIFNFIFSQNKLYLASLTDKNIQRCNTDGSDMEVIDFDTDFYHPEDMEVDTLNQTIYWTDWVFENGTETGFIRKANLDGSNVQSIIFNDSRPRKLFLDADNGFLYWTDDQLNAIRKSNLDLEDIETLPISSGLAGAIGIQIDTQNGRLFWSDYNGDNIWRANLDGTNETMIYSGGENVGILILSPDKNYIYSTDNISGIIFRIDIDGNNRVDLVTGLDNVTIIEIDFKNDIIYWGENYVDDGFFEDYCLKRASLANFIPQVIDSVNSENVFFGLELAVSEEESIVINSNKTLDQRSVTVFPNPFKNFIYVEGISDQFEYKLYQLNGKLVDFGVAHQKIDLTAKHIPLGGFILMIKIGEEWVQRKLFKID